MNLTQTEWECVWNGSWTRAQISLLGQLRHTDNEPITRTEVVRHLSKFHQSHQPRKSGTQLIREFNARLKDGKVTYRLGPEKPGSKLYCIR